MGEKLSGAGYKRPPKKHCWKKGQSGNPKGRPPRHRNLAAALATILTENSFDRQNAREGGPGLVWTPSASGGSPREENAASPGDRLLNARRQNGRETFTRRSANFRHICGARAFAAIR
jgi:hypothetical protein